MRHAWEISREMFLSEAEVQALLAHVRQQEADFGSAAARTAAIDRLIIETLIFSGLRNSEFCRLALADLNCNRQGASLTVRPAKSETPDRVVHAPLSLARLIEDYCETIRPACLPADVSAADSRQPLVFHERRRPFERTGLYRRVVRILTQAGLGDRASVQLLRHTYGYLAYLRTGGNLLFTQRQLGHAHPIVTSIYAQFVPESYSQLAERLTGEPPAPAPGTRRKKDSSTPTPSTAGVLS